MGKVGLVKVKLTGEGEAHLREAYLAAVYEVAERVYSEAAINLTETRFGEHIITDTGELLSSEELKKHSNGATITFNAPHASHVEYGIPAGTEADIGELTRWAERKLGLSGKEAVSAAWGIKTKIYKEGTEARPFLRSAIYKVEAYYQNKAIKA